MMSNVLEDLRKNSPGEYPDDETLRAIEVSDPVVAPRIQALRIAREKEREIVTGVVKGTLRRYDYEGRHQHALDKCSRDVGYVYRYAVFAMMCDSVALLEDKLLWWLRTILHAQGFPESRDSILLTYSGLRKEVQRKLPAQAAELLDPYFEACERILPMAEVPNSQ